MLPSYPTLSDADLGDLACGGDLHARDTLALRHCRWAWKFSHRYRNLGVPDEDPEAAAMAGLLEAAARLDASLGRFTTYAVAYLHKWLSHVLGKTAFVAALSDGATRVQARISKANRRLTRALSRDPTKAEIAAEIGETVDCVEHIRSVVSPSGVARLDTWDPGREAHAHGLPG
jgi:DNA-directed RNA polymerase specialized sigma subunit